MRIRMPQLGESVVEGTVSKWLKREGDEVDKYEPLVEIITDKVTAEYPSPVKGKLRQILIEEGRTVDVNTEIAEMELAEATDQSTSPSSTPPSVQEAPAASTSDFTSATATAQTKPAGVGDDRDQSGHRYSPAVRRLAEEHRLDLTTIAGTGMGGRVTRKDVESYIHQRENERPSRAAQPAAEAPAAPRLASPTVSHAGPSVTPLEEDQLLPLDPMRRAIAEHMTRSAFTAPHVTTVVEVDMTPLVRFRDTVKDAFHQREGFTLTFMPFVIRAVVESLKEHPRMNSCWSDAGIVLKKQINIGVAVALDEGLIVPVVHGADEKSLIGLARSVHDLAESARSNRLSPEDVQGGTFTVNNPGTFGTIVSTPIIVQPQAGILSTEAIVKRPVVIEDAIAIRSIMYVSLSFDHRILDGLHAARFLQSIKRKLELFDPDKSGL